MKKMKKKLMLFALIASITFIPLTSVAATQAQIDAAQKRIVNLSEELKKMKNEDATSFAIKLTESRLHQERNHLARLKAA